MTREHLLPKSVGGTVVVRACSRCNGRRGDSGTYPDFMVFVRRRPGLWAEAVRSSTSGAKTRSWLSEHGLQDFTIEALVKNP